MKHLLAWFFAALLVGGLGPRSAARQQEKADPFTPVQVAESFAESKPLPAMKEGLSVTPRLYRTKFFGKEVVWAGAFVDNPAKKIMICTYYVTLFDKEKRLLAAASQECDIKPGTKDLQLGSCMFKMSADDVKSVAFAQWRVVTAEKP